MAPSDWRSSLGFAARLTAVSKMQNSRSARATTAEASIYDEAQSEADYERLCGLQIAGVPQRSLELPSPEDDEYVPTPGGRTIGKYQNALYHREGLFSVIYKAPALEDNSYFPADTPSKTKVVALKLTTPSVMEPPHDSRREAIILKLAASDHVIPLLDSFRENGSQFVLVFPYMRYELGELLQDKKVSKVQGKKYLKDMLSGLSYIHSQGIIHRDIKPSNILLKSMDGPAYLSDFGISWATNTVGSEPADKKITDVGTTCYRPPELLFGNKQYGCSLDLWAAGCTVAEVLDPAHQTLFDSGELGSDLALIQSIFKKLGTPNLDVWPEAAKLPDWGKVQFYEYPPQDWSKLLPQLSATEQDLVGGLVKYESGARLSASKALEHSYFVL
ncbi:similar to cell division protein kinase [Plenodomus lingam JN3]|uniref:cyclin-dependent kinase n=1 Tax=Leptosphaeria maculans (strain JN3 / isolate v23.1.3 / race Av1-4-5-6-7-8) TaxID=985895 RepID=E5ACX4_LEPMJ|nr:similar to cell division protein kinase [Plenodomus lingam JN3]CBY02326.1 similar to cell division protein kinase [Plenodomus lingam JN3]